MKDSRVIKNGYETTFSGIIALDDVTQLELKKFNIGLTFVGILVTIGAIVGYLALTYDFNPLEAANK